MHPRARLGLLGSVKDRLAGEDREVRLLHREVDVEALDHGALPEDVDERVRRRSMGGNAAEVEDLLVDAGAEEGGGVGFRRTGGGDLGPADAEDIDEG